MKRTRNQVGVQRGQSRGRAERAQVGVDSEQDGNGRAATVAKVVEISAESPDSFEAAAQAGIARASRTLDGIRGAWIKQQYAVVENGRIAGYRVHMKVTFVLDGE